MDLIIKNGTVVEQNRLSMRDILIKGGKIAKISDKISDKAKKVINAEGKFVLAGFVDMHCHLREPGFVYKENIETGAAAAVAGGFTAVCCMPNTRPVLDYAPLIKFIKVRSCEVSKAKVYPIGAITKGQLGQELAELKTMAENGAVAFSDDGLPIENGGLMKLALEYAKSFNLLLISHAEDKSIAKDGVVNEGLNATIAGLKGISRVAEEAMIARDILLSESVGARIHIAHISTAGSVELIRAAKKRGVLVTCETCPHYFSLTDDEILSYNTNAKINPPLRLKKDTEAIIEGIKDGTIDAIATDHAPHSQDDKNREFDLAPFGTSGFETAFSVCYSYLVKPGHISLEKLSNLLSLRPLKILGLGGGVLKEGEVADLTVVDLDYSYAVDSKKFISKGKNSVFHGKRLFGRVCSTVVEGNVRYENE